MQCWFGWYLRISGKYDATRVTSILEKKQTMPEQGSGWYRRKITSQPGGDEKPLAARMLLQYRRARRCLFADFGDGTRAAARPFPALAQ